MYVKATVNNVSGLIIFPDEYTHPRGVAGLINVNTADATCDDNTITLSDWQQMEIAGAVFLPAAGYRYGTEIFNVNERGGYWSSTYKNESESWFLYFFYDNSVTTDSDARYAGYSVRLVKD